MVSPKSTSQERNGKETLQEIDGSLHFQSRSTRPPPSYMASPSNPIQKLFTISLMLGLSQGVVHGKLIMLRMDVTLPLALPSNTRLPHGGQKRGAEDVGAGFSSVFGWES